MRGVIYDIWQGLLLLTGIALAISGPILIALQLYIWSPWALLVAGLALLLVPIAWWCGQDYRKFVAEEEQQRE